MNMPCGELLIVCEGSFPTDPAQSLKVLVLGILVNMQGDADNL